MRKPPLRILHLIPTLELGGAQRQLSILAPALAELGHQVHVAFLRGGAHAEVLEKSSVVIHQLPSRGNYDLRILVQLFSLMRSVQPDIVQTWITQMDILGGFLCRLMGTCWVLREPSGELTYPPTMKNRVRAWTGGRASAIVSNSAGGDRFWQTRAAAVPRYIVPNVLPLEEIAAASVCSMSEIGLQPGQRLVLYAGRLDMLKNMENLILALEKVTLNPAVIAAVCGDGNIRREIEQMVVSRGLSSRILLMGFVRDVWSIMKKADVFVSVSHVEGRPNAVLEAMACGCPLVVSDIPAHREFLDEQNALIVDRTKPDEIARAILHTLNAPDEALRRAANAKKLTRNWAPLEVARQYEQVYNDILAPQRKGSRKEGGA